MFGRKLTPGCLHSDITCDGSPVKLTRLRATFKKLIRDENLYPDLLKVVKPKIRKDFVAHTNPTECRKTMDEERNDTTAILTAAFYAAHPRGAFSGWKAQKDWGLAHPANPEVLVGHRVSKLFDDGKTHYGTITKFDKWWHVEYEDGMGEDCNYHELQKQLSPEGLEEWDDIFVKFIYHAPDENCTRFLVESKGMPDLADSKWKLRGCKWKLINVFSNLNHGDYSAAYCPEEDYLPTMDPLSRPDLVQSHETVQISTLKQVTKWIAASKKLDDAVATRRRASGRSQRNPSSSSSSSRAVAPEQRNRILPKFTGAHKKNCLHCGESDGDLDGCYACALAIHRECAYAQEMDRVLGSRRGGSHWACDKCYKYMYPNG